ncbi:MAG TPA: LLM class flavin-dependent oxidoreductase [Acetobacteraceae bacterium]|nr:LLM class flavin-dependent oxidoreductase [Acetobacteraceae bacterium]
MIKRFHVLYVGQIALDNVGLAGTPANARRYPSERLAEALWTARDIARVMEECGFYALWTAEHHFQREGYECLPNLVQLGLWLATQTKRLKFGCAFNVLPMWHPIRLAEDYAMADIVTDGRIIMGVGRGYHTREVETFGGPLIDAERNRAWFEEALQLLLDCFNKESFHFEGKFFDCPPPVAYRGYTLSEITVVPRPKHRPVEIFMPVASGRTIEMMAKYGLKPMVTLNGEKILDDVMHAYQAACRKLGREKALGEDMVWGAGLCLAESREKAMRMIEPAHDERYKWFAPFGFVRYADEDGRPWGTPGAPARVPSLADGVAQKAWFCGPPEEVIAGIRSIEAKYPGLEDFMIHWAEGMGLEEFSHQLRWFAKDVMPAFGAICSRPRLGIPNERAKTNG